MADNYIGFQMKFSGGIQSPIVTGDRRLTLMKLAKLIYGTNHGSQYSEGDFSIMVQSSLVQASATATPAAVQAGDTITIAGQALTAAQKRATGTLTCASAVAGDTVVINGVTFTGVEGAAVPGEATFSVDTGDTETAASIAAQVNAYASPLISGILAAKSAAAVATIYAITQGTSGNAITLATTGGTITRSAATLENGAAVANNAFDMAGTDVTTGAALAYAINNSTTTAVKRVTASANASTGVVTITAKVAGPAGNAITLVSSNGSSLAVTGSGFLASGSAGEPTVWTF